MSIGISTKRSSAVKSFTIKNRDGSTAGTITIRRSTPKKTKKLQYRFKQISTQIKQARTSGNAREVLTRAKGETVNLRRKLRTGDYNSLEVRRAIRHAEQMERIAKKRMKHLQQEEKIEKSGDGTWQTGFDEEDLEESLKNTDGQDYAKLDLEEIKQLMQELQEELEQLEQDNSLEELAQTIQTDMDPAELEQLKKKHRAEEMREITEADMKYLKALFDQLQKEQQDSLSSIGGAVLELSSVDIPVQIDERSAAEVASASLPAPTEGGTIDISI